MAETPTVGPPSLLGLLAAARPTLRRGGLAGRGLRMDLERPELWLDWLEGRGRLAGG